MVLYYTFYLNWYVLYSNLILINLLSGKIITKYCNWFSTHSCYLFLKEECTYRMTQMIQMNLWKKMLPMFHPQLRLHQYPQVAMIILGVFLLQKIMRFVNVFTSFMNIMRFSQSTNNTIFSRYIKSKHSFYVWKAFHGFQTVVITKI